MVRYTVLHCAMLCYATLHYNIPYHTIHHTIPYTIPYYTINNKGSLRFHLVISSFDIFVLTCLMMASERSETCGIHVKAQLKFKKKHLCCVCQNKCSLLTALTVASCNSHLSCRLYSSTI